MGTVNETIHNVNSTLRTLLTVVLVGAAGYGGYIAYDLYNQPLKQLADKQAELNKILGDLEAANSDLAASKKEIGELSTQLDEKTKQVERLEVAIRLLKVTRRVARLTVLDQRQVAPPAAAPTGADQPADSPPTQLVSRIEFVEVNDNGQPIGEPREFDIVGDMVYVDYLHVSFDDRYVEESDLDRSTAICLFQRIFGEHQEPIDGFTLDDVGTRPTAYARGTEMSDFERKIWNDFWTIANDPQRAAELGIRAAQGQAVAIRVRRGKTYEVDLRATGEMSIRPMEQR